MTYKQTRPGEKPPLREDKTPSESLPASKKKTSAGNLPASEKKTSAGNLPASEKKTSAGSLPATEKKTSAGNLPTTENTSPEEPTKPGEKPGEKPGSERKAKRKTRARAKRKTASSSKAPSPDDLPSSQALEEALKQERYRGKFFQTFRSTVFGLITVAAIAVLVAVLFLPVLHIYGQSMNGTLDNGDIVLSVKSSSMDTGEIIAFYYNNNILVKRVIANSGQWVDIDREGNVYVNQKMIDEPYLREPKAYGETDIELPCQVPEGKVFVMGDNREVSIDSRNTAVGFVDREQIVGHIVFRVWPLARAGVVN